MTKFLNNPKQVLQTRIEFEGKDLTVLKLELLLVVRDILCDEEWSYASEERIIAEIVIGGVTNTLFSLENKVNNHRVIVRVFGTGTSDFIDRKNEDIIFANLSKAHIGPVFHGLFLNGRVEGFINGHNFSLDELWTPANTIGIAHALVGLHNHNEDMARDIKVTDSWLWDKIEKMYTLAENISFPDNASKQAALESLNLSERKQEYLALKNHLLNLQKDLTVAVSASSSSTDTSQSAKQEVQRQYNLGRLFGYDIVFCHNDLHALNMLQSCDTSSCCGDTGTSSENGVKHVTLIDYEYAAYNFRAYDLANYFQECCGFKPQDLSRFPSQIQRREFIGQYLGALNVDTLDERFRDSLLQVQQNAQDGCRINEDFITGFEETILQFCLMTYHFWAAWGVLQSNISTLDFDYMKYCKSKFEGFEFVKRCELNK